MICPGLHSVFNSLSLLAGTPAKALRFEVVKYDPRYRLFVVAFDGPIRGELRAFQRPVAQPQPSMHSLLPLVPPKLFAGRRVWVVGGSRGMNELSTKLLAAGGAEVLLTYSVGADDALRVVEEISAAGRGRVTTDRLDVQHDAIDSWVRVRRLPNAVLYFPSPRIFRKKLRTVERELLEEFLEVYVHCFARLCEALNARAEAPLAIFVPSTVYIDNRPRGLAEYAMAKAAAEVMVADLSRALSWLRFIVERLPRLATDQTATTFAASSDFGTEVLLQILQRTLAAPT